MSESISQLALATQANATDLIPATQGSIGPGTGTTRAATPILLTSILSVKLYGAKGDGITDDTAAINATISAVQTNGMVYFPAGTYLVSSAIPISKTLSIYGQGRLASTITTASATADIFTVTGPVDICDIGFNSTTTRTAGAYVNYASSGAARSRLSRFFMMNSFIGVIVNTTSAAGDIQITDGEILEWVATGGGVRIVSGLALLISRCFMQQGVPPGSGFGVEVHACGDLTIGDSQIVAAGLALSVIPGSGQLVESVWTHDTFFDNSVIGLALVPTGTGIVARCRFANCWSSSHTQDGIVLQNGASSLIDGVSFLGCDVFGNGVNGIKVSDTRSSDLMFADCRIAGNTVNGIEFFAGGTFFQIRGCKIGATGAFGNNGGVAIDLEGTPNNYQIVDNDLIGNTGGSIVGAGVQAGSAPGVSEFIRGNDGYASETYGEATLLAADTSVDVTHGLAGTPSLDRITLTFLTGIGTAGSFWVSTVTSTTFTINSAAAPGGNVTIAWQAKLPCT